MFTYNPFRINIRTEQQPKDEDVLTEMCDICGHSFLTKYIKRVKVIGKNTKCLYVVRCCPYCDAYKFAETL